MLNTPKLNTSDKIAPQTPQPVAPFPLRDQTLNTETSPVEIPLAKPPGQQAPKLPSQQALMPQNNPFDINSELIPFQEQEVEAVFKTPELDDFLLPQQALMPQNNPFDINSELIPFQEQEVEAVFKTPELDDSLLPCFRRSNHRYNSDA